ncbi:MAG: coproporphyrinogen III oxidase, partial [Cyanobacteriota bacterium]
LGREMLEKVGYIEIGMDHFALSSDTLFKSMAKKTLHRNFMGYTNNYTELLIGLGVSSISDTWTGFIQNNKDIDDYMTQVNSGVIPISVGHKLSQEDTILRRHILNIMCNFETDWSNEDLQDPALFIGLDRMKDLEKDGLVEIFSTNLKVTEKGKMFIRNICMTLDSRLWNKQSSTQIFSKAI